MGYFILKVFMIVVMIIVSIVAPLAVCYMLDLDITLIEITKVRYDESRQQVLSDRVFKIVIIASALSYVIAVLFTLLFIWVVI